MNDAHMNRRQIILAALAATTTDAVMAQGAGGVSRIIVPFGAGGAREMPARAIQ